MFAKTRAQLRDDVRRGMGMTPPIDTGAGAVGAVPVRNPWPTNPNVNMALDYAVAYVSRLGKLGGDALPHLINVAAQTANGPFQVPFQTIAPPLSLLDVKRVAWYPASGQETLLKADNRDNMERDRLPTMSQQPGTPDRYWFESSSLLVWPAPGSDGTLSLMFGQALWSNSQTLDGELLELVPTDYIPLVVDNTISLLCGTQPEDMVLRDMKVMADARITKMEPQFIDFCARRNAKLQGRLVPARMRSGIMRGRH